jgi:hypothetical protein
MLIKNPTAKAVKKLEEARDLLRYAGTPDAIRYAYAIEEILSSDNGEAGLKTLLKKEA